ncbi:MAG TPA: 1,4-alpha-glucan branching protein GlgB [Thiotrichales bacterium]|nr:1,4-alpha-glucan branching protein GlgB [Thiotrichales bacterium]
MEPAPLSFAGEIRRLEEARHHDPFALLGPHADGEGTVVRVWLPDATCARLLPLDEEMQRFDESALFVWHGDRDRLPRHYRIRWWDGDGVRHEHHDPYAFPAQLGDFDLHLFGEGSHRQAWRFLGAHLREVEGVAGTLFAVWAPNAERVSVVGDFNRWDGRRHPMRSRGSSGVWELFIPGVGAGALYKFEIRSRLDGSLHLKSDPYGRGFELRPATAAWVVGPSDHTWEDGHWMAEREGLDWQHAAISCYEVHLGSWQRDERGHFLDYRELARRLVDFVRDNGYTHIELLPITEHPLDASWGYQTTGFFAPTSRFGSPDDFRWFVDHCHQNGIGVILDWVPGHFPRDAHGLMRFDGTALYEHEDPRRGEHRDWGTLIFNYGRNEVRSFLLSSALYWLQEFHLDGLRVDAVASMLYLDYSRGPGEWVPNIHGGRENLEAIDFLRELNRVTHGDCPGSVTIAEESTAWPQVTRPTWVGGLGFSMKWNMGWMHDTLEYMAQDPIYRHYHHDRLTFGLMYAFSENFLLPFSHDEVVHGKGSMINKMPGDAWRRFANLRLLYTYMFTYPGKKLLFMGNDFAQYREWNYDGGLDWGVLEQPEHRGLLGLVRDLNHLYRQERSLHHDDFTADGFQWIDCHDAAQSVLSFIRRGAGEEMVVVLNFTPVPRHGYRIGVPRPGPWREVFNSDSRFYGGSDTGNGGLLAAEERPWMDQPASLSLTLPPLAGIVLKPG